MHNRNLVIIEIIARHLFLSYNLCNNICVVNLSGKTYHMSASASDSANVIARVNTSIGASQKLTLNLTLSLQSLIYNECGVCLMIWEKMSSVSPVSHTVESVRLPFHSKT